MIKELLLSAEMARSIFRLDDQTGHLYWRVSYGRAYAGERAGNAKSAGYLVVGYKGQKFQQHRVVWLMVYGEWPKHSIDHINGDRRDNRPCNLRDVHQSVNMQNIRRPTSANRSGVLGVYWSQRRGGWMASVSLGGAKKKRRGPYRCKDQAAAAYVELKRIHHEGCTL